MNKKLKLQLKSTFYPPKPTRKKEFLRQFKFPKAGRSAFILNQIGYIRKRVWLLSVLLLFSAMSGLHFYGNEKSLSMVWLVSSFLPFAALAVLTEILRSTACNMAELEMSCHYSYLDVVLSRLCILGSFNFILFSLLLLLFSGKTDFNTVRLGIYLFTPFLLTCSLSLLMLSRLNSRETAYICGCTACFVSLFNGILTLGYSAFADKYFIFWNLIFLILLLSVVNQMTKLIKKVEELQWNSPLID